MNLFTRKARTFIKAADEARDRRDWAEGARNYRQAVEIDPKLEGIWVQLGNMLKEDGRYDEAEQAYRAALALNPANADTHFQLGHALKRGDRKAQATAAFRSALEYGGDGTDAAAELRNLADVPRGAAPARGAQTLASDEITDLDELIAGLRANEGQTHFIFAHPAFGPSRQG